MLLQEIRVIVAGKRERVQITRRSSLEVKSKRRHPTFMSSFTIEILLSCPRTQLRQMPVLKSSLVLHQSGLAFRIKASSHDILQLGTFNSLFLDEIGDSLQCTSWSVVVPSHNNLRKMYQQPIHRPFFRSSKNNWS